MRLDAQLPGGDATGGALAAQTQKLLALASEYSAVKIPALCAQT